MMRSILAFSLAGLLLFGPSARAQMVEQAEKLVQMRFEGPDGAVRPGEVISIQAVLTIQDGWHINANKPLDDFLIPTEIQFTESAAYRVISIRYPHPKLVKFAFSETELAVYEHEARIEIMLKVAETLSQPNVTLSGQLIYQACNDNSCLAPVTRPFEHTLEIASAAPAPEESGEEVVTVAAGETVGPDEDEPIVTPELLFSLSKAYPGSELKAALVLNIKEGWHINSDNPEDEFLIPTRVNFDVPEGVEVKKIIFPQAKYMRFAFSEDSLLVYEGQAVIGVVLKIGDAVTGPEASISGEVNYQACNDFSCLPPETVQFSAVLPIASMEEAVALTHAELFDRIDFGEPEGAEEDDSEIGSLIREKGLALALIFIFLGGLALNLTPCVYPLIPITVSFFGGQASGNIGKMFALSVIYVLGIAVTYSIMGVVAALSGSLFGSVLQNPIVLLFVAGVIVALALSMFGVWELTVPQFLGQLAGGSRQGYLGALFMGLTVGIVAAPCIGPFVLALLTYVGTTGDPVLGFWLFFVLSLGLGLPYLVLGTFSGSLKKLPRSGMWMVWVKKIFGFVLLGVAAYLLDPVLPDPVGTYLLPAVLAVGGIVVGFLDRVQSPSRTFAYIKKSFGLAFIAVALWLVWPEQEAHAESWQPYSRALVEEAIAQGRPVIIDFTAEWCIACKELEKLTFPSKPVVERAGHFVLLRADLTKFASPPVEALKKEYNIKGLPTVIFLDRTGKERKDLRVIGFVDGEEFARRMDAVLNGSSG